MSDSITDRIAAADAAVAKHDRLAKQAGRPWYDKAAVRAAYGEVLTARRALHPWAIANEYADDELGLYRDE